MPAATESPLVLAKDLWGEVTEQGFTDEPTARAAAKQLNACWVLFRHTALKKGGQAVAHTYTELAKGGIGFAHGNVRKYVYAKHPATVAKQEQPKKESEKKAAPEPESPKPAATLASKSGKNVWDGGSWQPAPGQAAKAAAPPANTKQVAAKAAAAPPKVAAKAPAAAAKAAPVARKEAPKAQQAALAAPTAPAASSASPFARCCACFAGK